MPGGSEHAWERMAPLLTAIAADVDGTPCTTHVGLGAAGHFVKMIHNGIEHADMQLIGEAYDRLHTGLPAEPAEIFTGWSEGDLESYPIEITADVLGHVDPGTGRPFVDILADRAEQRSRAGGRCNPLSTSACPRPASPRPPSPAPCPAMVTNAPRSGRR